MLVPLKSSPENIACNTHGPELYVTTRDPPAQQPQLAAMSTQPDLGPNQNKDGIEISMEAPKSIPFRSDLHSLLVNELKHIRVTPMKDVMMQKIKETLVKALELGFQAANNRIISAFFHFLEMNLTDMTFDPFDPISIIEFVCSFRPACDTNGILKGAAM